MGLNNIIFDAIEQKIGIQIEIAKDGKQSNQSWVDGYIAGVKRCIKDIKELLTDEIVWIEEEEK